MQTTRGDEVSIGSGEGGLEESRPYRRSALPSTRIDVKRTEACDLCGRRQDPLDRPRWIGHESVQTKGLDIASLGPARRHGPYKSLREWS